MRKEERQVGPGSHRAPHDRSLAAAEARLYDILGLQTSSRRVALQEAPVEQARVLEVGEGAPLLFVHGAGMTAAVWAPLLAHLPGRRSICVDLPGCGLTDPFDYRGVDLREHARTFLPALLDALGLDAVAVVANSLGATYSLYLAAAHPARITRRILTSVCGRRAVANVPEAMIEAVAAATRISEPTTRTLTPELFAGGRPRPELALTDAELAAITLRRADLGATTRPQPAGARVPGQVGPSGG